MKKLWENCEKVVRKLWENCEKVVRMLWESCEKGFEKDFRKFKESCDIIYFVEEPEYIKDNKISFLSKQQKALLYSNKKLHKGDKQQTDIAANQ